jgi:pyruvate/2-oxoglutarate dehydrogenase complex dihydrolipoamide dehydrogenase (E3) component
MYDVIVIGGGPAGVTAALRACELGANVALVERARLGGTCTNDGCVPTRVLARAARLARDAEQFERYGLAGELPSVDLGRVLARVQQVVYGLHEKKQLLNHLEQAGATVYIKTGNVQFVDAHTIQLGDGGPVQAGRPTQSGGLLQAKKFIICAGGHARRLTFPGSEHALTHSDIWSLTQLPESVAIIGGAATGCQLASILDDFGAQVTVLEVSPRLLAMEDPLLSQVMEEAFMARGIQVITGIGGVGSIEDRGGEFTLHYIYQDHPQEVTAKAIVMATGWPGNSDILNLAAAGVESSRGYVAVDDHLCTTAEHIFAAGDITGRMMLVQSASYEARIAAENAVLGIGQRAKHMIVPHGGFTDPEYGSVGLTEEKAREVEKDCLVAVVPYADIDRGLIDGHTTGFCKLIVSAESHRLLGAHVLGEQALEVVHLVAAGMAADMWVEHLAELEIAYPTYSAIVGLAARKIVRELGVMPLSPEWRTLGRPHAAEWERSEY